MSTIFPIMSFDLCILTYHAMLNCDNNTISRQDLACCDPSFIFGISSFDGQDLVESDEKGSSNCQSQLMTSCRMFNLLAFS